MTQDAYKIEGATRPGRFVVMCDHASNRAPPFVAGGDLGLPAADMGRHIAFDIGAAGLSAALADRLDCPAIYSTFSRLVIDPNRGEDDPTLIMQLYDGTIIPANRGLDPAARDARLTRLYRPYHNAAAELTATRDAPAVISVHSFTPQLRGRPARPWQIGILYNEDRRWAAPLIERLGQQPDLCVGDNQPYAGYLEGDTMARHALSHGRPHILIELRNDLISSAEGQVAWADRLAPILTQTLAQTGL